MPTEHSDNPSQNSSLGCIVHLTGALFGNVALCILSLIILKTGRNFGFIDIFFWGLVFFLIYIRYIDITRFNAMDGFGKRATIQDWRRYIVIILSVSVVLWIITHALARWV